MSKIRKFKIRERRRPAVDVGLLARALLRAAAEATDTPAPQVADQAKTTSPVDDEHRHGDAQ